jgi:hypothetical protein
MELLMSVGFVALAIAAFMLAVKVLAILPAPTYTWFQMEAYENKVKALDRDGVQVRAAAAANFTD